MTERFRIYTRTGDSGTSSLYTGQRLPKDCSFFEALGDVDELNSVVGLAREFVLDAYVSGQTEEATHLAMELAEIQSRLLDVGSAVATPTDPTNAAGAKVKRTRFGAAHATSLEESMDKMDEKLPPLCNFILPSGGKAAAALHVARTVCRRAERSVVGLARSTTADSTDTEQQLGAGEQAAEKEAADKAGIPANSVVDVSVVVYVNRLSDWLFTAARYMAHLEHKPEVTYKKQDPPS